MQRLIADPRVQNAARVGRTFRIDPLLVLAGGREDELLRIAAHEVVQNDKRAAARRSKKPK